MNRSSAAVATYTLPAEKYCSKCGETKAGHLFGIRRRANRPNAYLKCMCKACESRAVAARQAARPEAAREYKYRWAAENHGSWAQYKALQRRARGVRTLEEMRTDEAAQRERTEAARMVEREERQRQVNQLRLMRRQQKAMDRAVRAGLKTLGDRPERAQWRENDRKRRSQPGYKLNKWLMELVRSMAAGARPCRPSLLGMLDFDAAALQQHLESMFQPGMDWEAFKAARIHIDHKVPRAALRFNTPTDPAFKQLWSLSNLQPMWAVDNMRKGARLEGRDSVQFQPSTSNLNACG